jgi:hypothetical protein
MKSFDKKYWIRCLLLLFILSIPEILADKIRNLNLKGILSYYSNYFNTESVRLRSVLGELNLIGDSS